MAYFDCQIVQGGGGVILTVTCASVFAGAAITATDGVTTLSQTCPSSSPYEVEFKLPNAGTWTISGVISGTTYTTNVVIPSTAELNAIPNGATATPTDVIQTWLHCANIWDKNYTTISQVLADGATVTALIASNNAANYMARSTTWASSVVANSSAMTKIGANDYCANKLLENSTWLNAICNSTYFESVLNVKVPTMTSNTTPSGKCISSSEGGGPAYAAFNGQNDNGWISNNGTNNQHLIYDFEKKVKIYKFSFYYNNSVGGVATISPTSITLSASDDNVTYNPIDTYSFSSGTTHIRDLSNGIEGRYFKTIVSGYNQSGTGATRCLIGEMQFYGREVS